MEVGVLCPPRRRAVPTNTPPNSSSRYVQELSGRPGRDISQSSWNMWSLGFVQKAKRVVALRHWWLPDRCSVPTLMLPSTPSSHNISRTRRCTTPGFGPVALHLRRSSTFRLDHSHCQVVQARMPRVNIVQLLDAKPQAAHARLLIRTWKQRKLVPQHLAGSNLGRHRSLHSATNR